MMRHGVTLKYEVICAGTSPDAHSSSLVGLMDRNGDSVSTLYLWKGWGRRHEWGWRLKLFALICVMGDAGVYRQGAPVGRGRRSTEEDLCSAKDLASLRSAHT